MTKSNQFLYQINFNRSKYPEICEALEEAKRTDSIANYLRRLIENDIASKSSEKVVEVVEAVKPLQPPQTSNPPEPQNTDEDLPDESGAFV